MTAASGFSPDCRWATRWSASARAESSPLFRDGRFDDPGGGRRSDHAVRLDVVGEHLANLPLKLGAKLFDLRSGADPEQLGGRPEGHVERDGVIEVVADLDR